MTRDRAWGLGEAFETLSAGASEKTSQGNACARYLRRVRIEPFIDTVGAVVEISFFVPYLSAPKFPKVPQIGGSCV